MLQARAALQTRDHKIVVVVADGALFVRPAERNEILALIWKVKLRRHHADDRIRLSVERKILADHMRICAKVVLPKRIT